MPDLPYTQIECKKDSLRQMQTGEWKISLTVQHADMPAELLAAPMGQRMVAVFIALRGDEEPKPGQIFGESGYTQGSGPKGKDAPRSEKSEGAKCRDMSHALCADPVFQAWICEPYLPATHITRMRLLNHCGIDSRGDFAVNPEACEKLRDLKASFDHRDSRR